jgi:hypothetical protein
VSLYAFIDDSGSEPSQPVYVLGGFIAPQEYWPQVANAWGLILEREPKIDYFKCSQVWDFEKGEFAMFTPDERRAKVDSFVDALVDFNMVAVSARLRWDDWRQFKKSRRLKKFANDPYFFLFAGIVQSCVQMAHKHSYPGKTLFVFDSHGDIGKRVEKWFPDFYDSLTEGSQALIMHEARFEDEKKIVPLQAADLFAWHHRKSVVGGLNEWQHQKWLLLSKRMNSVVLECGNLVNIAETLRVIQ